MLQKNVPYQKTSHTILNQDIRVSLTKFIYRADENLSNMILEQGCELQIIKKEVDYGNSSNFLFNNQPVISFGLTYTLFEDVTDNYGERPNDIFMDIMITSDIFGEIQLNRHIGSGSSNIEDIDYNVYHYNIISFNSFLQELDEMIDDFKKYFLTAIQVL